MEWQKALSWRQQGMEAGLEGTAHAICGLAVGARRDERRHALTMPFVSRHHERGASALRTGVRPREERHGGAARRGAASSAGD